jgi:hypothetical protein
VVAGTEQRTGNGAGDVSMGRLWPSTDDCGGRELRWQRSS